ncbi:pirin [Spirosoma sp. SC4-14]|uniref:pirin family protein n=1 Tax=Spirosoma sp. SC4-14 TaxID=3128900 RepID=UPI0030D37619
MDTKTEARIYLADQRGHSTLGSFQSFHSFNFGPYFDESRKPFGSLRLLNDDSLKAGAEFSLTVEEPTDILLLPVVGGLEYKTLQTNDFVEAGEVQVLSLDAGMSYEVRNPYRVELINFIQIWLSRNQPNLSDQRWAFNLGQKNTLFTIFSSDDNIGFIGKFDGRHDDYYPIMNPENGVFVFVVSGVFEVQNRLLHARDGLALTNIASSTIEFEALSNDAILLLIEVTL